MKIYLTDPEDNILENTEAISVPFDISKARWLSHVGEYMCIRYSFPLFGEASIAISRDFENYLALFVINGLETYCRLQLNYIEKEILKNFLKKY